MKSKNLMLQYDASLHIYNNTGMSNSVCVYIYI
jgi:hypothetical protein